MKAIHLFIYRALIYFVTLNLVPPISTMIGTIPQATKVACGGERGPRLRQLKLPVVAKGGRGSGN